MKLLLFSDLHCSTRAARSLVERAKNADIIIGAGDFGVARRRIGDTINVLRAISKPAILVPGNAESDIELRKACRSWPSAHVLHGTSITIDGITFFGLGGGIPVTPFGAWSFDLTEENAAKMLEPCPKSCVLITHSPPKGAVDVSSRGRSLGSIAIRHIIEEKTPQLVVCGHIHDCAGQHAYLGKTPVVNAGPGGYEWTLQ